MPKVKVDSKDLELILNNIKFSQYDNSEEIDAARERLEQCLIKPPKGYTLFIKWSSPDPQVTGFKLNITKLLREMTQVRGVTTLSLADAVFFASSCIVDYKSVIQFTSRKQFEIFKTKYLKYLPYIQMSLLPAKEFTNLKTWNEAVPLVWKDSENI